MNKFGYVVLTFLFLQPECRGELRLLQIVFQNGIQSSETTYQKDPYNFWLQGPAKLAMVGMIRLFRLGQHLRRKYDDFVTAGPDEVDLQATERAEPCSSLSQCFLSGLYKPQQDHPPIQGDFVAWQAQSTRPTVPDKYAEPELKCPRLQEASSRIYESEEGSRIVGESMNMYQYWSQNSGMDIRNPTDARELYQSLQLEKSLNLSTPTWADRFWPELQRQSDIHFAWMAKNQLMQKAAAGPLLGTMIQRMQRHIDGRDHKKYYVYSGHNSSLAGLLAIFGAYDGREPPSDSTVVLELHKFGDHHYVKVLYFYSTRTHPHSDKPEVVVLRRCSEYCPFHKFKMLTSGVISVDWEDWDYQCGKKSGAPPSTVFHAVGIAALLVLFCLGH